MMGAEESKGRDLVSTPQWGGRAGSTINYPNSCRNETEAQGWSLLHHCSLEDWQQGHAEKANFGEGVLTCDGTLFKECSFSFCMSRQGIINIDQSRSVFSFRRRSRFAKMAEHFEYNHIPAQMSSINHFRVKGVLCFRERLVVLHLARNANSQFGALDLRRNKFLALFGKQSVEFSNVALCGEVSPDLSHCLVRLPAAAADGLAGIHIYDVRSGALLRHLVIDTATVGAAVHFAFDPRFSWRRAAITSFAPGQLNSLSLVGLDTWQALRTNTRVADTHTALYPHMRHLAFSRDGAFVIAVIATADTGCTCRSKRASPPTRPTACSIYVLSGDTACTLHCVCYHRTVCALHACPVNYTPLLSACASRLAVLMDAPPCRRPRRHPAPRQAVHVYKLPSSCPSLQAACRSVILQRCHTQLLSQLPIPARLLAYLHFEPEFE